MTKTHLLLFFFLSHYFGLIGQDSTQSDYAAFLTGRVNSLQKNYFTHFVENNRSFYLHKDCYRAYQKMKAAAAKDSVMLFLHSAGRSFGYQKSIWERKFANALALKRDSLKATIEVLRYSAMPGTSRHHWGTEIDLNALNHNYFQNTEGKKVGQWLLKHAHEYGFCLVYDNKAYSHREGYKHEPWHWSYMPKAHLFLHDYREIVDYKQITGFSGAQYAQSLTVFERFVNGIGFICKDSNEK